MKRLKLFILGLCVILCMTSKAQVVFSEDERNFVLNTSNFQAASSSNNQELTPTSEHFKLSGIKDNWFASAMIGGTTFIGSPSGCGDFFDRTTPTFHTSFGKWHSPYFGTRLTFDGIQMKGALLDKQHFQNYHLDLMLNTSSFHRLDYGKMPKWNFVAYVGPGVIHNSTLKKTSFAIYYGLMCSYRIARRVNLTAEVGATSTHGNFDGIGTDKAFGDHLLHGSLGLTLDIGKLGWEKKKLKANPLYTPSYTASKQAYPKNSYRGLNELLKRMESSVANNATNASNSFDAPILFFFKINSTHLIDPQQKVEIAEIAATVKEYDLKVKIIGAADSKTGTVAHNRKLSIKRAKYIAKLLIEAGVPKEKMSGVSQGGINIYKPFTANRHTCIILYQEDSSKQTQ